MLRIDNLCISFDHKPILTDISLHLKSGQIACLLGASGCGKTTLLRCIAGFETPDSGEIYIQDKPLYAKNIHLPAHKRQIGMVFQDYALFPHLTVADNIAFGLSAMDKTAKSERVAEMLVLIGMSEYANYYPHELSGGQQQRVALVRALAPRPSLILLDEPFSNLDVELRTNLSKEVRRLLISQNVSAILVTHDQAEAFAMADVVGLITHGRLQQWGTPDALYHQPVNESVARFIGEGVLIDATKLTESNFDTSFGRIAVGLPLGSQKALIRPHDVKPSQDPNAIAVIVIDRDFRGGYWLYTLQTHDEQILLMQISMATSHCTHHVGDKISVMIHRAFGI